MAAADAPNFVSSPQSEQLTAPPGWTKKLVPAKAKNATLRKHDVVFIAPDGQEIPSQWHLRRYLKAHPGGPGVSDFNWSSGEESIRRSGRASTKEISYSEKIYKGKRNAPEVDAGEVEERKAKTSVSKRAKNVVESDVFEDQGVRPIKDELMNEVQEGAAIDGDTVIADEAEPVSVHKDEFDINKTEATEDLIEEQIATAEAALNLADVAGHEKQNADVMEQVVKVIEVATHDKSAVEEDMEQVVIVKNGAAHGNPIVDVVVEGSDIAMDVRMHDKSTLEEVVEQAVNSADVVIAENPDVAEVLEQVVEMKGLMEEAEEQLEKVTASFELGPEEIESKQGSGETSFNAPNGQTSKTPVVGSDELQDPSDKDIVESNRMFDQNFEVTDAIDMEQSKLADHNSGGTDAIMGNTNDPLDQILDVTDSLMVESKKPVDENLEVPDTVIVESTKLLDENIVVTEHVKSVSLEIQDHREDEKSFLEPFMQREEKERGSIENSSPIESENIREKSPNEISSSSVPARASN